MINPGFNSDATREKVWILGDSHQIFWTTEWRRYFSYALRKWGTYIEQMRFIAYFFVKMCGIDILWMCRLSASFQMDEWPSSLTTTDTVLISTSIMTVLILSPIWSISADSLQSVNALCHLRMIESCEISFWEASFNGAIVSTFTFF